MCSTGKRITFGCGAVRPLSFITLLMLVVVFPSSVVTAQAFSDSVSEGLLCTFGPRKRQFSIELTSSAGWVYGDLLDQEQNYARSTDIVVVTGVGGVPLSARDLAFDNAKTLLGLRGQYYVQRWFGTGLSLGYSGISQSISGISDDFSESAYLASAFRIASVTSLWGQFANRADKHRRIGYGVKLDVTVGYEVGRVTRNEALVAAYESGKFDRGLAQATIDYMIERNASLRSHGICLETSFGVPISFGKRVYLLIAMQYSFVRLFLSGNASVAYPSVSNVHTPSARVSLGFHLGERQ